jgi:hypothetical protein
VQLAKANADKTAILLAEAHCKAHKYEGCKEVRNSTEQGTRCAAMHAHVWLPASRQHWLLLLVRLLLAWIVRCSLSMPQHIQSRRQRVYPFWIV